VLEDEQLQDLLHSEKHVVEAQRQTDDLLQPVMHHQRTAAGGACPCQSELVDEDVRAVVDTCGELHLAGVLASRLLGLASRLLVVHIALADLSDQLGAALGIEQVVGRGEPFRRFGHAHDEFTTGALDDGRRRRGGVGVGCTRSARGSRSTEGCKGAALSHDGCIVECVVFWKCVTVVYESVSIELLVVGHDEVGEAGGVAVRCRLVARVVARHARLVVHIAKRASGMAPFAGSAQTDNTPIMRRCECVCMQRPGKRAPRAELAVARGGWTDAGRGGSGEDDGGAEAGVEGCVSGMASACVWGRFSPSTASCTVMSTSVPSMVDGDVREEGSRQRRARQNAPKNSKGFVGKKRENRKARIASESPD
jgi:hypothetical protein